MKSVLIFRDRVNDAVITWDEFGAAQTKESLIQNMVLTAKFVFSSLSRNYGAVKDGQVWMRSDPDRNLLQKYLRCFHLRDCWSFVNW